LIEATFPKSTAIVLAATVRMGNIKQLAGSTDVHFHSLLREGFDSVVISLPSGMECVVYKSPPSSNIRPVA